MKLRFTEMDAIAAADEWGFNCGPAAVAAICGLSLSDLRPHLGDFESKRYTNPTLMAQILRNVGAKVVEFGRLNWRFEMKRTGRKPWPRYGLARVQWEGPWTKDGVPIAARYRHTHWVGTCYANQENIGIWDVNCLNNGTGWVGFEEWTNTLVPWLLKECHPRSDGKWHLTHTVEIEAPRDSTPSKVE
jgi:hypothetical protein